MTHLKQGRFPGLKISDRATARLTTFVLPEPPTLVNAPSCQELRTLVQVPTMMRWVLGDCVHVRPRQAVLRPGPGLRGLSSNQYVERDQR